MRNQNIWDDVDIFGVRLFFISGPTIFASPK